MARHEEGETHGEVRDERVQPDAEALARRRLAFAQIRQYPDRVLRLRANEVEELDADLVRLVERMEALMRDANGVGLAGNQVGVLRRVFVFSDGSDDVHAVVNPEIVERGGERETDTEGCLSLAGVLVPVERTLALTLTGRSPTGDEIRLELEGQGARVVQHELDHLDGVLILDRTDDESRRQALAALRPQPVLTTLP